MIRRIPSLYARFALILVFAVAAVPCVAAEYDDQSGGQVVDRSELDLDDIKPGDDYQPTVGLRRRGALTSQVGVPDGGSEARTTLESAPAPAPELAPPSILRTWFDVLRAMFERAGTLR